MDMLVFLIGIMRMSWGTECENWQHLTRKKHARVGRKKGDGWCTRSYVRLQGGQCGEVVRALELQDSFDPILHTINHSYYSGIATDVFSQIAECPAVSKGSPNVTKPTKTHIEALTYIGTTEKPVYVPISEATRDPNRRFVAAWPVPKPR